MEKITMQLSIRSSWYLDWFSAGLTVGISLIGLLFIFSATYSFEYHHSLFFIKQTAGILLGLCVYGLCIHLDYRSLMRWGYFAYFALIVLLVFTLIKGSIGMGAQRWINLYFFKLQPAELTKLFFPAFVAYYFYTHRETHHGNWKDFVPVLLMLGISFILILKQPDLGTALIIGCSGLLLLWFAGLSKKFFMYGGLLCVLAAPLLWNCLKPYQKKRITVFLGQGATQKERYQIEQALIAVGSGSIWGKGLLQGTQNKLQFLPESRTDFIFAVLCEEWGFVGALTLLLLYVILFLRTLMLIMMITKPHVQLCAAGLLIHLLLSAIINICMVLGLLPIVGIPLPLMSYGLSNLIISFASLGWIQGMYLQQH